MDKLIFFHMKQLGDCLFSLPVLHGARRKWPGASLISCVDPQYGRLLKGAGLIDEYVDPAGDASGFVKNVLSIRNKNINKAVFFSESPRNLIAGALSGIPQRIGFDNASLRFLFTEKVHRCGVPSPANFIKLGNAAGIDKMPSDYSGLLALTEESARGARAWLEKNRVDPSRLVAIAAGTSRRRAVKKWDWKKWNEVLSFLVHKNMQPVLFGSSSEKEEIEKEAVSFVKGVKVHAEPDSLDRAAALIKLSKFAVSIDSGIMHLAAALEVPVIALFGPTDPSQIGPMPLEHHTVIKENSMRDISAEQVMEKIGEKLCGIM